ncbi:hypothetical protein BD408DRAFT_421320 [Parasitella parasitica]|nr:hypothetical protein BD408DRAFT_421320 [Parasitella parasitica]
MQFKDSRLTEHIFYMLPSPTVPQNEKKPGAFEYYPLLLIKATNQIRQEMINWFDKKYIATCTPLFMYPLTMADSVDIWIDSILDLQEKIRVYASVPDQMLRPPLMLEYTTGDENLSTVTVKISRQQALEICKRIPDPRQFLRTFEAHVENTAHFRLNTLTLYQVTSSVANVRKDGHVKISPHAYKSFAIRLLQGWIDLAVEKVFPDIGTL